MSPNKMPVKTEGGDDAAAPTHSQPSIRSWWVVNVTLPPLYPRERTDNCPAGGRVGLETGLDGTEYLAFTVIQTPDLSVRSESLYRLQSPNRPGGENSV